MFQTSNTTKTPNKANYFIREDRNGNPQLARCSTLGGYSTRAAAKDANIKEIKEEIQFHLGLLRDIEKAKERQGHIRLYRESNCLLDEIEKAVTREKKVRRL